MKRAILGVLLASAIVWQACAVPAWVNTAEQDAEVAAPIAASLVDVIDPALATSLGIQVAHTPHSLTVTWPDATTAIHGFLTFLVSAVLQFAGQHALYEGLWRLVVPSAGARRQATGVDVSSRG